MSLRDFFRRMAGPATVEKSSADEMRAFASGFSAISGITVTEDRALRTASVYACVRVIASTLASLPLKVYRRTPQGKESAEDHQAYQLLHDRPNPITSSFDWREGEESRRLLGGNSYALVEGNARKGVTGIWPLDPGSVTPRFSDDRRDVIYDVRDLSGATQGSYPSDKILHVRDLCFDGLRGVSRVSHMRDAVALAIALEEHGSRFFINGARPGGILKTTGKLTTEKEERLRASWNKEHEGVGNTGRVAILEEGFDWVPVSASDKDAQYIESREFQAHEIARIFGVFPWMIGLGTPNSMTYSNVEQQMIAFVTHTIRPICVRWEQQFNWRIFKPSERGKYFTEFCTDGLLRGDIKTRFEAYSIALAGKPFMVANEVREMENRNPLDGGYELQPEPVQPAADPNLPTEPAAEDSADAAETA